MNNTAKRYKKMRKAGEHQGGKTVFEMNQYALGPQYEELTDQSQYQVPESRPYRIPTTSNAEKKGAYNQMAPTPQA